MEPDDGIRIEKARVRTVMAAFKEPGKDGERFASVTEWINGEGFDVEIDGKPMFSLTETEVMALLKAMGELLDG